jgi:hypothetical protein
MGGGEYDSVKIQTLSRGKYCDKTLHFAILDLEETSLLA